VVGTDANQGTRLGQNPRRLQADPGMTACDHTNLPAKVDSRCDFFGRRLGTEPRVQRLLIRLHIRDSGRLSAAERTAYVDRTEGVVLNTSGTHGWSFHARSRCGCNRSLAIPRVTLKTFACPPLSKRGEWTSRRVIVAGRNTRRVRGRSPR